MKEDEWDKHTYDREELSKFAMEIDAELVVCSAFSGNGIEDLFMTALKMGLKTQSMDDVIYKNEMPFNRIFLLKMVKCTSDTETMEVLSWIESKETDIAKNLHAPNLCLEYVYEELDKNILHFTLDRKFNQSSSMILKGHTDFIDLLLTQMDKEGRTIH